jgi:hypothetical protein
MSKPAILELLNWIAMRGALTGRLSKIHGNYHISDFEYGVGAARAHNQSATRSEFRRAG